MEKRAIFLDNLVPKPAPKDEDLLLAFSRTSILTYRAEKTVAMRIVLEDDDGTLEPAPAAGGGST